MRNLVILCLFIGSFNALAWPKFNNPHKFEKNLELNFKNLKSHASLTDKFIAWPGNHWSSQFVGISQRWSSASSQHFTYHLYSKDELNKLEQYLIDELSPAEKFDILNERYDYPTVIKERRRTSPDDTSWFGICHGVAPASLNHEEPQTNTINNRDGIELTFYSSDVKALISYYYAQVKKKNGKQIGRRCTKSSSEYVTRRSKAACEDMDPAAFHILITNFIGKLNKSFIVDIDPWNEVWNHVPNAYDFDIYEEYKPFDHSTPGTVKVLWIGMKVTYAGAIAPYFDPVIGKEQGYYIENNYQYELDLDKDGYIIGGKWISDLRPDFIWTREKVEFTGYWQSLNQIYKPRKY